MRTITSLLITVLLAALAGPATAAGPMRADLYPDYTDIADADQLLFWRTSATDLGNMSGLNFKAWLKSMLAYDADGDGYVNAAEGLNDGLGNVSSASDVRAHLDDPTQHRLINDAGVAGTDLWSASKIAGELAGKATSIQGGLAVTALQPTGDGSQLANLPLPSIVQIYTVELAAQPRRIYEIWGTSATGLCDGEVVPSAATETDLAALEADIVAAGGSESNVRWECVEGVVAGLFDAGDGYVGVTADAASLVFKGGQFAAFDGAVSATGDSAELTQPGGPGGGTFIASDGFVAFAGDGAAMVFKGGLFAAVDGYGAVSGDNATLTAPTSNHTTTWETGLDGWTAYPGPDTPWSVWGRVTTGTPYAGSYHFALTGTDDGAEGYTAGHIEQTFASVSTGNLTYYGKGMATGVNIFVYRNGVLIDTWSTTTTYAQRTVAITGGSNVTIKITSDFGILDGAYIDNIVIPGGG
jgi:hypothetical protein